MAPKNSYIIKLWLEEFENAINMGFDEYNDYITNKLKVKLCNNIEKKGTYLTINKTIQVVLQYRIVNNNYTPNLLLLKSEDSMLKISNECEWNSDCIKNRFENNIDTKKLPYIKLINSGNGIDMEKYFSKFSNNNDNNNNEYNIPKIIWTYWDKEELPKLINQIYNNNIKILSDWKLNILNDKNINTYVDNINTKYNSLGQTHKSDYIRLKLLKKYGGV